MRRTLFLLLSVEHYYLCLALLLNLPGPSIQRMLVSIQRLAGGGWWGAGSRAVYWWQQVAEAGWRVLVIRGDHGQDSHCFLKSGRATNRDGFTRSSMTWYVRTV
jgi:hypothetical protein